MLYLRTQLATIVSCVSLLFASVALAADNSQAAVIGLNNEGVTELTAGHYDMAIQKFEQALKLDRNYDLARDNLAITFNNKGLHDREHPRDALKLFHRAMLINQDNPTTRQNMEGIIRMMGLNPSDYHARISLAESALHTGEFIDAAVEYGEALRLHEDLDIRNKRDDLLDTLDDSCLFFRRKDDDSEQLAQVVVRAAQDSKTPDPQYINRLARRINRWWRPPEAAKSKVVVVQFKVDSSGTLSDLQIAQPSGMAIMDGAALDTVRKSLPMLQPPSGAPDGISVVCTFALRAPAAAPKQPDNSQAADRQAESKQSDTRPEIDFGPYMAELQRRIKSKWYPPHADESKRIVVQFKVHTSGDISDLRIDKSSGIKNCDQAALQCVEDASPFAHLPAGADKPVDIQFTFDYNVFGSNISNQLSGERRNAPTEATDTDTSVPTKTELAKLDLSSGRDISLAVKYAAAFERHGDFLAAGKLYQRLDQALRSQMAAIDSASARVKLINDASHTTEPSKLLSLVIDVFMQISKPPIGKSAESSMQEQLATDMVHNKVPIWLIKETLNKRKDIAIETKLLLVKGLLRVSINEHDPNHNVDELRPLVASYEDRLRRLDDISDLEKAGFAGEVQGLNEQAIKMYSTALASARQELGGNNQRTYLLIVDLARVTAAQGNFAESQILYEQAIMGLMKLRIDWQLERVFQSYGDMLNRSGQKQHAASVYAQAQALWQKHHI